MAAIKNVFVMKGGGKPSKWKPGESYITSAQLKARHRDIVKMQKAVLGKATQKYEDTVKQFKKDWPKVRLP